MYAGAEEQLRFLVGNVFREGDLELERPRVAKKDNLRARRSVEVGAYDLAVRLAEDGAPVLLEAFFLRGELALARGRFADGLEDFKLALEQYDNEEVHDDEEEEEEENEDVPRYKIYHRMAQCHAKMKRFSEAVAALSRSVEALEANPAVEPGSKAQLSKQLRQCAEKMRSKKDHEAKGAVEGARLDDLLGQTRNDVPVVSAMVEFRESERQGRHSVAAAAIPCGAVLAVDRPITALLNPGNPKDVFEFCLHCLRRIGRGRVVPCGHCSSVVFCSRACREAAREIHALECRADVFERRQTDTADAFRIFLSLRTALHMCRQDVLAGPGGGGQMGDERFRRQFAMVDHAAVKVGDERVKNLVLSIMLYGVLLRTGYFGNEDVPADDEARVRVMVVLHRLLEIQDCNTHPILAMDEDVRGNQVGLIKLGNANYLAIGSFFNHSCAPNTCRVNAGDATVLVATRNIAAGEEIADIYSMHYSENGTKQRREWLSESFFFECKCRACEGDWPPYEELEGKNIPAKLVAKLRDNEEKIREELSCLHQSHSDGKLIISARMALKML